MSDNKDKRFSMRIEGDFKDRLDRLMAKHGIDASSVVRMAIAQMAERDLPQGAKKIPRKKEA